MQVQALGNLMKNGNNLASYAIQTARRTHKQQDLYRHNSNAQPTPAPKNA